MQELLHDGDTVKVTLQRHPRDASPLRIGPVEMPGGSRVLWFTFPGRHYEVAVPRDPAGHRPGCYTNLVRPPEIRGRRWRITDLFLDVWQPAGGDPEILDREEWERARRQGWIPRAEADAALRWARDILRRARRGRWPPPEVRRWGAETAIPSDGSSDSDTS